MENNNDTDNTFSTKQEQIIGLVVRQTDYEKDYIINFLIDNNWDYVKLIKQYLDLQTTFISSTNEKVNTNQAVIKEMRTFLDEASSKYYRNKEIQEIIQQQNKPMAINRLANISEDIDTKDNSNNEN
jgi:hypothetical protein